MNLHEMSSAELRQLRDDVDEALVTVAEREKAHALAQVQKIAAEAGVSLKDLISMKSKTRSALPPKYMHPENGDLTWSGKGRQPQWFKDAIEEGKSPEELEIAS